MTRRFAIALLLAAGGLGLAQHDQPGKPAGGDGEKERAADRAAIQKTFQQLLRAIAKGDAAEVAAFWTNSGEYVGDDGEVIRGRKALTAAYKEFFAKNKGVQVQGKAQALRFLGQDTALAEGTFTRRTTDGPTSTARLNALLVREKGQWRLGQLREEERSEPARLEELKWLIGDWTATAGEREVSTRYAWDEKKVFINGRFTVSVKGKVVLSGRQIIGQDPATGGLRSWVFDSEGGFGGGVWERDGKAWVVESEGTQADGTSTFAVNVLTPVDADTFTWQSQDRVAGEEETPETRPVKVKRVKKGK